jgi:hypothetical protein
MVFMLFLLGRALDVVAETELQRTCHRLGERDSAVFATKPHVRDRRYDLNSRGEIYD